MLMETAWNIPDVWFRLEPGRYLAARCFACWDCQHFDSKISENPGIHAIFCRVQSVEFFFQRSGIQFHKYMLN